MLTRLSLYLFLAALVLSSGTSKADRGPETRWLPPTGDWHDPVNWDNGVPDLNKDVLVNQGTATFSSPAVARQMKIGVNGFGRVIGTATLDAYGTNVVGSARASGMGASGSADGRLSITGGDLNIRQPIFIPSVPWGTLSVGGGSTFQTNNFFTGAGELEVVDGDINVHVNMGVGTVGGTGTNSSVTTTGKLHLVRGDLTLAGVLLVGRSSGTGEGIGHTDGEVLVEHGDVISTGIYPGINSSIFVGAYSGQSSYTGHGQGSLELIDGRIAADEIRVGFTSAFFTHGSANGRLTVRDGRVEVDRMFIGQELRNGGPAEGLVELIASSAIGHEITVGNDGKVVFGISGSDLNEYGHVAVTAAAILDGDVEARFSDGFQPAYGDSFDLITAGSIADNYSLSVTGLTPQNEQYLRITRTTNLLRIHFVPEASSAVLALVACAGLLRFRG